MIAREGEQGNTNKNEEGLKAVRKGRSVNRDSFAVREVVGNRVTVKRVFDHRPIYDPHGGSKRKRERTDRD
jgi:hypothetical protein